MMRFLSFFAISVALANAVEVPAPKPEIERAFNRLYNFDFIGAHEAASRHIAAHPHDPFGYTTRASIYLFYELDRMGVLEGEFFASDDKIADRKQLLKPDPTVRDKLFGAVERSKQEADAILARNPNDTNALFAMAISHGVTTDYMALIEKKQIRSLSHVKTSTAFGQRLLKIAPNFYDAYLATGVTEYLVGSLPFFVRWFVRIDEVKGDKNVGMEKVAKTAENGHYLKPFAKVLLAIANLREKRPTKSRELLAELAREFPENQLFRKELDKLTLKLKTGELRDAS